MSAIKITDKVYYVGVKHPQRRIFDELISLPEGTTYNSYLIKGSTKTVLIDTVDPMMKDFFFDNLKMAEAGKIDYIISDHAEQDHSGCIPFVLQANPNAKVITNEKCASMLKDFSVVTDDKLIIIKDGETLSLGDKTLEFILTPWVHWPETMSVYLREDEILFSCDLFGSHVSPSDILEGEHFYIPAKRYFAEIMCPFRNNVRNNMQKLEKYKIKTICPSHGVVYTKPEGIINAYKQWATDEVKNEVILAYVSMHDSTKKMAEYLRDALEEKGITVNYFDIPVSDIGEIAMMMVDSATMIIGGSTVLAGLHPAAQNLLYIANALRPKTKFVSYITSYGWGEKAGEVIKANLGNFKAEVLMPVISKGLPKEAEFKELNRLANDIAAKHREIGVLK
ncbi:MAG: FprA family A-type flavoprotein [bacterium]